MNNRNQAGFSLLELLIVVAVIAILVAIAIPMMRDAMTRAHISAAAADAHSIQVAFKRFYIDNNMYPNSSGSPAFDLNTFEPLVSAGYYDGRIVSRLVGQSADGYDSPDDEGENQEYWLELTLDYDPTIRFLVADSNDAPLGGGSHFDGLYLFRNGVLTALPGNS